MLQITGQGAPIDLDVRREGKLRILQILPHYYPAVRYGGPIRSVHALSKSLVERGNEVHVYTSSMDGPEDLQIAAGSSSAILDGVQVHYFPVPMARRLCWCPGMANRLKRDISRFDVVHLNSVFQWPTYAAARIAAAAGVPYLVAPRGMLGGAVIRGKSRLLKSLWIQLIEQRTLRQAAGLHVTTRLESQEIHALGLKLPPHFCVHNSVSWPERHTPLESGPLSGIKKPYALFLSRLDWKKGLDRLIEAWQFVPDLALVIAGNDEHGYARTMQELAEKMNLADRVRFIGAVSDAHKWGLYENAMMFLLPSYSENFGNVVAEAMVVGCPVVVTPEVGLADLVRTSGSGIVVDGAPAALAAAITDLIRNPETRRRMGERGRATVRQRLSADSAAAEMELVYRTICVRKLAMQPSGA